MLGDNTSGLLCLTVAYVSHRASLTNTRSFREASAANFAISDCLFRRAVCTALLHFEITDYVITTFRSALECPVCLRVISVGNLQDGIT